MGYSEEKSNKYRLFMLIRVILILFISTAYASLPELTNKDVRTKANQILKAHVNYHSMNKELIKRAFVNFIDELDPSKTYFIEKDIKTWSMASNDLIASSLEQYKLDEFTEFSKIYEKFLTAIQRRQKFELFPYTEQVDYKDLKDLTWAKTEQELIERISKIKALQLEATKSLKDEEKETVVNHLKTRRLKKEKNYLSENESLKNKRIYSTILKAISSSLDCHTNYFTPSEANQFMIDVQQRLFGIGAQLRDTFNGLTIMRIIEGGPADLNGILKINDRIIAVDQEPIVGLDILEGVEKIRGNKGTSVKLTVLRESENDKTEKLEIEIIRDEVVVEDTRFQITHSPFADGIIAKVRLFSFYQDENTSSAEDIKKVLDDLKNKHTLKGVILDLRGNTGGLLVQAVAVTGLFIHQGIVVSVKDNHGKLQHLRDLTPESVFDGPLLVLTDRASASAAEIVAQTLRDYGRSLVVGDDQTFGKGSFQTFTLDTQNHDNVNQKGEYKVTRGRYYTVSGKSPQLNGVKADIEIPGIFSEIDIGEKFGKYPLKSDQISANFKDDLSDIPLIYRLPASKFYNYKPQQILDDYTKYLSVLKQNSHTRLKNNKQYQDFLTEIKNKNFKGSAVELFSKNDLQLIEAVNILKDLIFFMEIQEKRAS